MTPAQYERVRGAALFARAMGCEIGIATWGITDGGDRWEVSPASGCMCPMAALIMCEQPPSPPHIVIHRHRTAAARALSVEFTRIEAFTAGWDEMPFPYPPMNRDEGSWYEAGARMRRELLGEVGT